MIVSPDTKYEVGYNSTYIVACSGHEIKAEVPNPAVTTTLLKEIKEWTTEGAKLDDIVTRLRQRTVPTGYVIHNWDQGMYNLDSLYLQGIPVCVCMHIACTIMYLCVCDVCIATS